MGKHQRVIIEFTCDRCDHDGDPGEAFRAVTIFGDEWLCARCWSMLEKFMLSQKTPASIRFNAFEDERLAFSREGITAWTPKWLREHFEVHEQ